MDDCERVNAALPVRQGDVLKRVHSKKAASLAIVVTADCDIANGKYGDAGLACVQLMPLADYMLSEHAQAQARRQLKKRFEKLAEWINKRWLQKDSQNVALTEERVQEWVMASSPEAIAADLGLPADDVKGFLGREGTTLRLAQELIDAPVNRFSAIDVLRALQSKPVTRGDQLRTLFGSLDHKDLPLDMFFVSNVPGEPGIGFIARLRALSFIPFERSFTSMAMAKEADDSFVRVGRLAPTFRHALAQQFGMLFARIGMPTSYEEDREEAFALVADQIVKEMEEK